MRQSALRICSCQFCTASQDIPEKQRIAGRRKVALLGVRQTHLPILRAHPNMGTVGEASDGLEILALVLQPRSDLLITSV